MKIKESGNCSYCQVTETPEHAIFACHRWAALRMEAEQATGELNPDNIVARMLESPKKWSAVESFIKMVVGTLAAESRRAQESIQNG